MADITRLARLLNGATRGVDLASNTLVVNEVKVGGASGSILTKAILDKLILMQGVADADGSYDSRYYQKSLVYSKAELNAVTDSASGADQIGSTAIAGVTGGTVQSQLESLKSLVDSAGASPDAATVTYSPDDVTDWNSDTDPGNVDGALDELASRQTVSESNFSALQSNYSAHVAGSSDKHIADKIDFNPDTGANWDSPPLDVDAALNEAASRIKVNEGDIALKAADADVVKKAGSTMDSAANITFQGDGEVLGLPSVPSVAGAAASKAYVDAVRVLARIASNVRVASTADVDLSSAPAAIDGVTLSSGDRVLIWKQTDAQENGVYDFNGAASAMTRSADLDNSPQGELYNGVMIPKVLEGTLYANTPFVITSVGTGTDGLHQIATDDINFGIFTSPTQLSAGTGIDITSNIISVDMSAFSTSDLSEGTNLYYTQARFNSAFSAKSTDDLSEGATNKYYASSLFDSDFSGKSTSDLSEGTNLYFTDARAKAAAVLNTLAGSETDQAPSVASVNTALAGKAASSHSHTASDVTDFDSAAKSATVVDSLAGSETDQAPSVDSVNTALDNKADKNAVSIKMIAGEVIGPAYAYAVRLAKSGETDTRVYKASNNSIDNALVIGMVFLQASANPGDEIDVYRFGEMESGVVFTASQDEGKEVYLNSNSEVTLTPPSTEDSVVVKLGNVSKTGTGPKILVNIEQRYIN